MGLRLPQALGCNKLRAQRCSTFALLKCSNESLFHNDGQRIFRPRDEEEVSARQVTFETQIFSLQAQQEVQHWEQQQQEAFTNRQHMVEHRLWQKASQQKHAVEVAALQRSQRLKVELHPRG